MFEFDGIPCQHMLAYMTRMFVVELLDRYILQRWTKAAKASRVMDDLGSSVREICGTPKLLKRSRLFQLDSSVIDDCILCDDDTRFLEKALVSL